MLSTDTSLDPKGVVVPEKQLFFAVDILHSTFKFFHPRLLKEHNSLGRKPLKLHFMKCFSCYSLNIVNILNN